MSEWQDVRLGDVADILVGFAFKSSRFSIDQNDVRLLRGTNIHQGFTDWGQEARWPLTEQYDARYQLGEGDVVLAMDRPWIEAGLKRARLRKSDLPALLVQRVARLRGTEAASTSFIHHTLATEQFSRFLQSQVTGATVPHISQSQIASYPLKLPPSDVQEAICSVLNAFDDLIANSRQRVQVLEGMARAIYYEWFVKFRYPGHEDVPLVDSSFGPIPEGWAVHPISAVVDYHIGGGWGTEQEDPGSVEPGYVIRGTDIPRVARSDVSTVPFRFHGESNLRSRTLRHGDIVFEVSGGSKGQPVGRSLLIRQSLLDALDAPAMCASFCKLVRVNPDLVEPSILIRLLQDAYSSGELNTYQVQSTGITNFKWKPFLEHFRVVLPPKRQQEEMVQVFDRLDDLIANAGRSVGVLAEIRDMLLPKLVSGQIEVSSLDLDALLGDQVA
ncbi:restriction endonuclease subunit S [soil metagenome]